MIEVTLKKSQRSLKKQISILIGEVILIMNISDTPIDSEQEGKLWTDLFVLLNALKPSLKYDAGKIVQNSGQNLVEAFKSVDKGDTELGFLIGETIADLCLTVEGESLGVFSKFLYSLVIDRGTDLYTEEPHLVSFFS